jgi:chitinase
MIKQTFRRFSSLVAVCSLLIAAVFVTFSSPTPAKALPSGFKIVGYFTSWGGVLSEIQLDKLTHVNYAFILANDNGTLQALPNPNLLRSLVSAAHARGVKVLISVGGWNDGNDSAFEIFSRTSAGRSTFVNAIVNLVNEYNLDGADIDWEYPDPDNGNPDNPQPGSSAHNFYLLMSDLSTAMHSRGKLLTGAIVALGWAGKGVPVSTFPLVDFYNIMAYDGGDGDRHSPYQFAVDSLNYWRGRGLPAEKAVLGVPFYGRPSWQSYRNLLAAGCSPNSDTCQYNGSTVYYNGIPTIRAKTRLAMQNGGGVMYWESSQDTMSASTSLSAAIYSEAGGGTGNPTNPPGPTATRTNTPIPPTTTGCNVSAYVHGTVYVANNEVSYNGRKWRAKWWTQNEYPSTGGSGVWEDKGPCSGGNNPTPTRTNTPGATFQPPTNTPPANPTATSPSGVQPWSGNSVYYAVGALVSYNGRTYRCIQAHTSLPGWDPQSVPALWTPV